MKRLLLAYLCGALSVLGYAYHCGSDAIVQAGLKLAAMQTTYHYDAQPAFVVDEAQMVAELARPMQRKGGSRPK